MSLGRADIEAMLDDVFELGSAARLTPPGGAAVDVRAIPRIVDVDAVEFGIPVQQTARVISLLRKEAPERPVLGATVEVLPGGMALAGVYTVQEDALASDRFQLVWTCRVSEPQ